MKLHICFYCSQNLKHKCQSLCTYAQSMKLQIAETRVLKQAQLKKKLYLDKLPLKCGDSRKPILYYLVYQYKMTYQYCVATVVFHSVLLWRRHHWVSLSFFVFHSPLFFFAAIAAISSCDVIFPFFNLKFEIGDCIAIDD